MGTTTVTTSKWSRVRKTYVVTSRQATGASTTATEDLSQKEDFHDSRIYCRNHAIINKHLVLITKLFAVSKLFIVRSIAGGNFCSDSKANHGVHGFCETRLTVTWTKVERSIEITTNKGSRQADKPRKAGPLGKHKEKCEILEPSEINKNSIRNEKLPFQPPKEYQGLKGA